VKQRSTVARPLVALGGGVRLPLHVLLLLPALVVLAGVILYPIVSSAVLSFFNYDLTSPQNHGFIGTKNFTTLAADENFWLALKNTLVFTFGSVLVSLVLGLAVAFAIDQVSDRYGWLRGVVLLPWIIPAVVVGYLFLFIFDVDVGLANFIMKKLGLIEQNLPWLMRANLAMAACVIANIWNQTPFYILMFAAGLKTIPQDVKEATLVSFELFEPGITAADLNERAQRFLEGKGYESLRSHPGTQVGFCHGLGHGLGLEVHEEPFFGKARPRRLEPGMVITIEPGVYYPEKKEGIRIEDVAVVREGHLENLTRYPMELEVPLKG